MININTIVNLVIKLYQIIFSPLLGSRCRYSPSCSEYMSDAVKRYGFISGILLGIKRLLRCHPWADGGYDPVIKYSSHSRNNTKNSQINRVGDDRTT